MADDKKDAEQKQDDDRHAIESIGRLGRARRDGDLSKKPDPKKEK